MEANPGWGGSFGWNTSLGSVGVIRKVGKTVLWEQRKINDCAVQDVAVAMQALQDGEQELTDKILASMDSEWVTSKVQENVLYHG